MSHIIEAGGAVKDGEAPPPLICGYMFLRYILKVDVRITGEIKEAL
jgi:hypothetical protein